jgi:glutamate-1-semialdehyde 2,1-aminomutase
VRSFAEAKRADEGHFRRFFAEMLDRGVYLAPSPFEAGFVSLAHSKRDIARTVQAARESMQRVAADR